MPDIKLKNQNGIETTYEGINSIKVPNTNGEYEEFFTASSALGTINTCFRIITVPNHLETILHIL